MILADVGKDERQRRSMRTVSDMLKNRTEQKEQALKIPLRLKRLEYGLSQQEIAKATGFHASQITNWERGNSNPNLKSALIMARFFETTVEDLFGYVLEDEGDIPSELIVENSHEDESDEDDDIEYDTDGNPIIDGVIVDETANKKSSRKK